MPAEQQIDGRIVPVLHQNFKPDGETFNPNNVMIHFLVSYPKLRSWGTHRNGLYPVNVLLTRDLLAGPMGTYLDATHPLTGASLKAQREAIDKAILAINALPNWSDANGVDRGHYAAHYDALKSSMEGQDIAVDAGDSYWNQGLGILQLSMAKSVHVTYPGDNRPYLTFQSPDVAFLTSDPQDWGYAWNPSFNANILGDMSRFVYDHMKAGRMEVLINGIQNKAEEVDEAAQALQRRIDQSLGIKDPKAHTPVIAQYNVSSKLYFGSWKNQRDIMDLGDILRQKWDTGNPDRVTENPDSIRLIATLRALTQILWSREYQLAFYQKHLDSTLPSEYWRIPEFSRHEAKPLRVLLETSTPLDELDNSFVQRVPKWHATLEEDFPVDGTGKSDFEISQERKRLIAQAAEGFKVRMKEEFFRLYAKLSTMPVTLHAHSQGAIIAAVVHSRLGDVPATRKNLQGVPYQVVSVGDKVDLITYGGAANMYDWGPMKRFKSYTHHVNVNDAVTKFGMGEPFQNLLMLPLSGQGDLIETAGDHGWLIRMLPPQVLLDAWRNHHKVIFHRSSAAGLNIKEHSMVTGYVCNANPAPSALIPMNTPNKYEGKLRCNDLQPVP